MADHMKFKTARFNLRNEGERRAYEIIEDNEAAGVSFKQLAVLAILKQEGVDLTEFLLPQQSSAVTKEDIERMLQDTLAVQLEHYTDELLRQLKKRGGVQSRQDDDYDEGVDVSDFGRNFARGYAQRSRQGDDE